MKNTTRKIILFTISIIFVSAIAVMISFNFMMQAYIQSEAMNAIKAEKKNYYSNVEAANFEKLEVNSIDHIQVATIYLDEHGKANKNEIYYFEDAKTILDYCNKHVIPTKKIVERKIDGKTFYMTRVQYEPVSDGDYYGDAGSVVLFTNVTTMKTFAQSMNRVFVIILLAFALFACYFGVRLGKQVENSQEKMKQFFQNVSHELKTPIMSIQGYAEGLQTDVLKDKEQATQIIIDESRKMSNLAEELLYISKIDSGQMKPDREKIYINELIYDCLSPLEIMAKNKGIHFTIEMDDSENVVNGDEKQLAKAFGNIIVNAIKYAETEVKIKTVAKNGIMEIIIEDDGKGINEKDMPYIFERFYTGENGNTGIGLALAKEIVEIHGGKIAAHNSDKGASFNIVLKTV